MLQTKARLGLFCEIFQDEKRGGREPRFGEENADRKRMWNEVGLERKEAGCAEEVAGCEKELSEQGNTAGQLCAVSARLRAVGAFGGFWTGCIGVDLR